MEAQRDSTLDHQQASKVEYSWYNIIILAISSMIWIPFQSAIYIYIQPFMKMLGADVFDIALTFAISTLVLMIVKIPGGYLTDRVGRRILIVTFSYIVAAIYIIGYFATSWVHILILFIIQDAFLLYQPALSAIVADSLPPEKRGRGFAVWMFLPQLSSLVSPFLAMYLLNSFGDLVESTKYLFLLSCVTGLIAATLRLMLRETIKENHSVRLSIHDILFEYKRTLGDLYRSSNVFVILYAITGLASGLLLLIQYYYFFYLNYSYELWAVLMFIGSLTGIITALPAGWLSDKIGRRDSIVIGSILSLISLLIWLFIPESTLLMIAQVLSGISGTLVMVSVNSLLADIIKQDSRGMSYAVTDLIYSTTSIVGQGISGVLYDKDPKLPLKASLALFVISSPMILKLPETINKNNLTEEHQE